MKRKIFRWTALFAGFIGIAILAFVVIPVANKFLYSGDVMRSAKEKSIDSTGLFYTETEEAGEAYNYLLNNRRFPAEEK